MRASSSSSIVGFSDGTSAGASDSPRTHQRRSVTFMSDIRGMYQSARLKPRPTYGKQTVAGSKDPASENKFPGAEAPGLRTDLDTDQVAGSEDTASEDPGANVNDSASSVAPISTVPPFSSLPNRISS